MALAANPSPLGLMPHLRCTVVHVALEADFISLVSFAAFCRTASLSL